MSEPEKRSAWDRPRVVKPERDDSWMDEGACVGENQDWFFPERGDTKNLQQAKAICNGLDGMWGPCPVRGQCLEYALLHVEKFGLWGGKTERERRRIRKQRLE